MPVTAGVIRVTWNALEQATGHGATSGAFPHADWAIPAFRSAGDPECALGESQRRIARNRIRKDPPRVLFYANAIASKCGHLPVTARFSSRMSAHARSVACGDPRA